MRALVTPHAAHVTFGAAALGPGVVGGTGVGRLHPGVLHAVQTLARSTSLRSLAVEMDHVDPSLGLIGDDLLNMSIVAEFSLGTGGVSFTMAARVESPHGVVYAPCAASRVTCSMEGAHDAVVLEHHVDEWEPFAPRDTRGFLRHTDIFPSSPPSAAPFLHAARALIASESKQCGGHRSSAGAAGQPSDLDWAVAVALIVRCCCMAAFMRPASFDRYTRRESAFVHAMRQRAAAMRRAGSPGAFNGPGHEDRAMHCPCLDNARAYAAEPPSNCTSSECVSQARAMVAALIRRHPDHYDWQRYHELSGVDVVLRGLQDELATAAAASASGA
eukprot:Opistho-2@94633